MAGVLGEYTAIFLEESEEQVEELNTNLVLLEKDHTNKEIINDIFRAAHSLKSSAAFVGLYNLSDLAHTMENLLQKIRENKIEINLSLVNLLFECFDQIKYVIVEVSKGNKIDESYSTMIQKLKEYEEVNSLGDSGKKQSPKELHSSTNVSAVVKAVRQVTPISAEELRELEEEVKETELPAYDICVILKADTPMKGLRFSLILQSVGSQGEIFKSIPSLEELERGTDLNILTFVILSEKTVDELRNVIMVDMVEEIFIEQIAAPVEKKEEVLEQVITMDSKKESSSLLEKDRDFEGKSISKSIKVSSDKLDQLMNNVGELVITNSGFQKIYDDLISTFGEDLLFGELKSKIDQINRISKDLQSGIMNTRMVPIGTVFNRFTRLVRDLSIETGKKVELVLAGENTELDKKVVDVIGEPLMHLIRNAIDHGIESPEERKKSGKNEAGIVKLNAYQGGNNIMVEISDDGRGMDKARILKKAIQNGLVTQENATGLSDSEIYNFIYMAGFSTADKISDISGRGVGMNVVNKLIQEFKGKIIISNMPGQGASFTLCFPQALAIISSILVVIEEEVYAFPLSEVIETIRINREQITTLEGHEIINLRGEVLPIYSLAKIIGLAEKTSGDEVPVIIVNYNTRKLGFIVDDLIGKHETVIKSLEKNFKNVLGLTGASIMGDGTIILVLDIPGLVESASSYGYKNKDAGLNTFQMKRIGTSRSLDAEENELILKTENPTNIFNKVLYEIISRDKSRQKSKKQRVSVQDMKALEEKSKDEPKDLFHEATRNVTVEVEPQKNAIIQQTSDTYDNNSSEPTVEEAEKAFEEVEKAKEIIKGFKEQTQQRFAQILPDRSISDMLSKDQIKKLESVVNTGMMNAGLVLSQLVGSNVELYIPEIALSDKEALSTEIRNPGGAYYGLKVRMNGELNGNLLMMFTEENGKELAHELIGDKKNFDEIKSLLGEISNIVCASVINSLSNKTKSEILPSVPEFYSGSFLEVIDMVKPEKTKFLAMHTEFIHGGDNVLGNLLFLPDFDELVQLIKKM